MILQECLTRNIKNSKHKAPSHPIFEELSMLKFLGIHFLELSLQSLLQSPLNTLIFYRLTAQFIRQEMHNTRNACGFSLLYCRINSDYFQDIKSFLNYLTEDIDVVLFPNMTFETKATHFKTFSN